MRVQRIQATGPTQRILPTQGLYEFCRNVPFRILVMNVSKKPTVFYKYICIASGYWPTWIYLGTWTNWWTRTYNVIKRRLLQEEKDRQTQVERYINMENYGGERMANDWKEEVEINQKLDTHHKKFMEITASFESMWDDHPCCISVPKHRIEIASNEARSIHRTAFTARPRAREIDNRKVHRTLKGIYLTRREGMGWFRSVCSKNGRITTFLGRLQEVQRPDCIQFLSYSNNK